jgi:hypothetical protein
MILASYAFNQFLIIGESPKFTRLHNLRNVPRHYSDHEQAMNDIETTLHSSSGGYLPSPPSDLPLYMTAVGTLSSLTFIPSSSAYVPPPLLSQPDQPSSTSALLTSFPAQPDSSSSPPVWEQPTSTQGVASSAIPSPNSVCDLPCHLPNPNPTLSTLV